MSHGDVAATDGTPCPVRAPGTRAKVLPRSRTRHPRTAHAAIPAARQRHPSETFGAAAAHRAGGEGTRSHGVRACGLRTARDRGRATTPLQHVATAAAIHVQRVTAWGTGQPPATTRHAPVARLAPAA